MNIEVVELGPSSRELPMVMKISEAVGFGKFQGTPAEYLESVRQRGAGRVFAARRAAVVLGFAEVVVRPSEAWSLSADAAYIYATAVDPRHAKAGVARELMLAVLERLGREGYKKAVGDVRWDNAASLNLCVSVGARIIGPSPEAVMHAGGNQAHLRVELSYAA